MPGWSPAAPAGARSRARSTAPARSPRSPRCRSMSAAAWPADAIYLAGRPELASSTASCCSISAVQPDDDDARGVFRRRRGGRGARATTPKPRRSTGAASPSIRATPSPPSTAPTACAAAGRRDEARARLCPRDQARPGFVEAWFNFAGAAARRAARLDAGAPPPRNGRSRSTPALCRRRLQSRDARIRRRQLARGAALVGGATSSSTPTLEVGASARHARHPVRSTCQLGAESGGLMADQLPLRRPRGRPRHHPARPWRRRADGFGLDERHRQGAAAAGFRVARFEFGYMAAAARPSASRRRAPRR